MIRNYLMYLKSGYFVHFQHEIVVTLWKPHNILLSTDHVPGEVGQPVEDRFNPADKLKVFGFADALLDQKKDETGRHKGHGKDHTDGNQNIHWCGHPERGSREKHKLGTEKHILTYIKHTLRIYVFCRDFKLPSDNNPSVLKCPVWAEFTSRDKCG